MERDFLNIFEDNKNLFWVLKPWSSYPSKSELLPLANPGIAETCSESGDFPALARIEL